MNKIFWLTSQYNKNISEDIEFAIKNWIKSYSLNISYKSDISIFWKADLKALKNFSESWWILIIHMPYFLPINTCINEVFDGVFWYFEKVINKFVNCWLKIITIHWWYIENKDNNKISLIKNLEKILKLCNIYNIDLSIENDDLWLDYPICTRKDIKDVMELKWIGLCYDIWHYNTVDSKWVENIFIDFKDRINVLHIHNNFWNDTHNNLNNLSINIKRFARILMKEAKDYIIIFEIKWYKNILEWKKIFEEFQSLK